MAPHLRPLWRQFLSVDSNMSGSRKRRAPKRGRKSCKPEENGGEDRLSDLPDAILCHILSFLDTKYAVATSVLSMRWKHLFIYIPNIILDDSLTRKISSMGSNNDFAMFGRRQVMVRKVPYINQFCLKYNFSFEDPVIENLVRAAVWRNVKEIDICMGYRATIGSLPCELFTSTSLVILKLKAEGQCTGEGVVLLVSELVCLPNLKLLHLDGFRFGQSVNTLFRGCPLLEDLCLFGCFFWDVDVLDISFPFLRKLSISYGDRIRMSESLNTSMTDTELVLDTPNLEFFEYNDHTARSLEIKKLTPHARAEFDLCLLKEDDSDSDDELEASLHACEFVDNLHGLKSLYLSMDSLEAMYPRGYYPSASEASVFGTLTLLELDAYDLRLLPNILACAPELERLIIREHAYMDYQYLNVSYPLPQTVPVCLANSLSHIEFRDFDSSEDEFELLRYLLQNGKVLKRLKISKIDHGCTPSTRESIRKRLETLSSYSKTCKVVLEY